MARREQEPDSQAQPEVQTGRSASGNKPGDQASQGDAPNPTLTNNRGDAAEGVHETKKVSEASHHAGELEYRDLADDEKPDPSTIAQEQVLPGDKDES